MKKYKQPPPPKHRKFHVKTGDVVRVIAGDYKGVEGRILKVIRKLERVHVEGVAKIKRTAKASQQNPQGGFKEIDRPIHISNVKKIEATVAPDTKKTAKPAAKKAARKSASKKAE
jgi:large subunit ribosomal protein L24